MSISDVTSSPPQVTDEDRRVAIPRQIRSCVMCQQRKVRCDRAIPCSSCARHGNECLRSVPPPPRPKVRKVPRYELKAQIRSYEKLLEGHGVALEGGKTAADGERADANGPDSMDGDENEMEVEMEVTAGNTRPEATPRRRLVSEGGPSTNNSMTGLKDQHRGSDEVISRDFEVEKRHYAEGGALLFGLSQPITSLANMHPPPVHIFKLWQTYLDNINPLSKVIHAPTVQRRILEVMGNPSNISKPMEALMFAIYAAAVNSMEEEDCEANMGDQKSRLLATYLTAAQEALIRAGFLKTRDFVVLQAFTIFLLTVREGYNPHALWVLTGAAVRICQRLGLHRDGTSLGLSIFETEMRRRVGWQVAAIDSRSAQLAGMGPSVTHLKWDAKMPLNVNDSDLDPEMRDFPIEYEGLTEMVFCLVRYEFGNFLRDHIGEAGFEGFWENLSSAASSIAEKDRKLDELERLLEHKYIRHCDPSIPLHALSVAVARTAICRVRLLYHHPRQYGDKGAGMPQSEKDILAINALQITEHDSLGRSMPSMKRFLWHVNCFVQLDAFVFLLHDPCRRAQSELAERAWQQVYQIYNSHPSLVTDVNNRLYFALGDLTLSAWDAMQAERTRTNGPAATVPHFVPLLRSQRRQRLNESNVPPSRTPNHGSIRPENRKFEQSRIQNLQSFVKHYPDSPFGGNQQRHYRNGIVDPSSAGDAYSQNVIRGSSSPSNKAKHPHDHEQSSSQNQNPSASQGRRDTGALMEPVGISGVRGLNEEQHEVEDTQADEKLINWSYWDELLEDENHISEEGGTKIFI